MLINHRGWSKECSSCVHMLKSYLSVYRRVRMCPTYVFRLRRNLTGVQSTRCCEVQFSETERSALSQRGSQRWPGVPTKLRYSSKPPNSCYKWSYQWSINIKAMPQTKQSHYDQSFGVNLRAERWGRHKLGCWSQTPSQQVLGEQRGRPSPGSPPPHYSASGSYQVPLNLLF